MGDFDGLDFDGPLKDLETKMLALRKVGASCGMDMHRELGRLERRYERAARSVYAKLTPWQKVQVARHGNRPRTQDYVKELFSQVVPLSGDRLYGEDKAISGGLGEFRGRSVVFLGHEKGKDLSSRARHNFGMAHPEGYRKAKRLMHMAQKFGLPVICFVDTPGAYPGADAEERGQGEAIGSCLKTALSLDVPTLSVIIGEGGSGGAVAMATANGILMLEHSVYSVISPEGGASILYRSRDKKDVMAESQRLTAQDLFSFGVIDEIIPEPLGGAHRGWREAVMAVGDGLERHLQRIQEEGHFRERRQRKFLAMTSMDATEYILPY
jgi:acetyl-CoA carboxylase carboxyl transferase subunit alpha